MSAEASTVGVAQSMEELRRELAEAREQQAATAGILAAISNSPTDAHGVFAEIAARAARLCGAPNAGIFQLADGSLRLIARHGSLPGVDSIGGALPLIRGSLIARAVIDRKTMHVADLQSLTEDYPEGSAVARQLGHRTIAAIPLIRAGQAIGVITVRRAEALLFTERQIELLKTFADQAVIAIENTRLFESEQSSKRELGESLEYQTAISEVLGVISRSPSKLEPVMQTIASTARKLCQAERAIVWRIEGDAFRAVAFSGMDAERIEQVTTYRPPLGSGSTLGRAALARHAVQVLDTLTEPGLSPVNIALSRSGNIRTVFAVPLLRDGNAIGGITLSRTVVAPFTDPQIALVETFADQAVIAIENARLFEAEQASKRELSEALEYQTAISEVLGAISRSPSQLQPVFDTIVAASERLCQADRAQIFILRDGAFHLAAHTNTEARVLAHFLANPLLPSRRIATERALLEGRTIHVPDVALDPDYDQEGFHATLGGARLAVPLLSAGRTIGVIALPRTQPLPFSQRQIDLVTTFADQAVIAIENTRLFEAEQVRAAELQASSAELAQSLEYQTAISNVLDVISRSPNEVQPVLDTIVTTARRLCDAERAIIWRPEGEGFRAVAYDGLDPSRIAQVKQQLMPTGRGSMAGRAVEECRAVHVQDVTADPSLSATHDFNRAGNIHTALAVPLLLKGEPAGAVTVSRTVVSPFNEKQIELLKTFADQAAIAIENTRLFEEVQAKTRELQESLEQQTATSEVLSVISSSPTDVQPVLDAIVRTAVTLCASHDAVILLRDGKDLRIAAHHGPMVVDFERALLGRDWVAGRAVIDGKPVHVHDLTVELEEYPLGSELARRLNQRTVLGLPLLREGQAIGCLFLRRTEVLPFSDKQIALLEIFTDQAVIAIENARLFEEVREKNQALTEAHAQVSGSLERETATSEILRVIGSSPTDVRPVFETIARSGVSVCGALGCVVFVVDGSMIRMAATHGVRPERLERFRHEYPVPLKAETDTAQTIRTRRMFHLADIENNPNATPTDIENARLAGYRTRLMVPMVREDRTLGLIAVTREDPTPFPDQLVELLRTFADQAVIAIENARLFEEVQTRTRELSVALERQTAMSEILGIISASPGKLDPVFDAILKRARELCDAKFGHLLLFDGQTWRPVALHNVPEAYARFWHSAPVTAFPGTLLWNVAETQKPFHLEDARLGQAYLERAALAIATVELGRARTLMGVPLLKDGKVIGAIVLYRTEVRPFDDQQIALLSSFAAQAVIAVENARLLADLQERQTELARSVEELKSLGEVSKAVNFSLDLAKVLPTILEHACAMSYASGGTIYVFDKASGEFHLAAGHNMTEEHIAMVRAQPMRLASAVVGECAERREAVQIADLETAPPSPTLDLLLRTGVRAVLAVPLLHQDEVVGALVVRRNHSGAFSAEIIRLLEAFAAQSAIAVHNARLFKEVEDKGRQLAVASQHKSQFVANMSHELRTPLAAILGYAELMQEGIYGALPDQSTPIVGRIRSNGTHLLGLINTVLDLSKIEAGQFSLSMSEYALDGMVENVRVATESLAQGKSLALKTEVAHDLPFGIGDEQRLTQVLLNLVGNAIKFTDVGEVRIAAAVRGGRFAVAVTDTGPGIPPEEQHKIFEEFHQVDNSNTKRKGGTGLGLAIAKQIVEMHGGRIWVESSVGKGSTFRMELPVRAATAEGAA